MCLLTAAGGDEGGRTQCLKLVSLARLAPSPEIGAAISAALGEVDVEENSAILKDGDRYIRCAACAMRCPVDAITMERVTFRTQWRTE